ncbi:MAG: hypothetical protein A2176_08695 [Spirochaetes bacterium RBG_13_51_14]|nr:MAG: hypothetical protein A2176_08695 [Spirochaetes bacterium RBG_13_51_14]
MNIAIEAFPLSSEKLTGIGNVTLNYLRALEKIDAGNNYYIYTFDDLLHFDIPSKNWYHVNYDYRIKYALYRVTDALTNLEKQHLILPRRISLRILKIILEVIDTICRYFWLAVSMRKNRIDVYVGIFADFFPLFFFYRTKKIWLIHDLVWKLYPETTKVNSLINNQYITRNMNRADLLLSVSESTKYDIQNKLNIHTKTITLHNAADRSTFFRADAGSIKRVKKKYGISKKYILSVCTIEPRKNLATLLEAYALMKYHDRHQLVLVGMSGWKNASLFGLIEAHIAIQNIIITGYIPSEDLAPIYTGAEVFVFPTLYEGFGMPALEAMQCGCPVISSTASSIPEVVGDAGILVDPLDVAGLAESMETVLSNKKLRMSMIRKGLARARLFSWETSARRLLEIIQSL